MTLKTLTINEFCNVEYGTRVVKKKDSGTIYPVYGGGGETFFIDKTNRQDRVIISRFAMSEECTRFVKGKFFLNDSGLTLSPKTKDLSQEFLDKIILSLNSTIYQLGRGTAQRNLDMKKFRLLKITYPTLLSEQQRIVAKLDAVFTDIDKTIYTDEQKLLKINLFKQALLKCEFNIDSEKTTLSKVVKYDKQNGQGSNLSYIGMENISSETMKIVGEINVPEKTSSTFKFNNSHLLFGRLRPYLKKVLIPNFEGQCSTEIFCLKPSEKINKKFLAYWLLSPSISYKINNSSTGARMPRANMKELLNYQFPVLSLPKQQQIVTKIDTAFDAIDSIKKITEKKIANYQFLKLSILSQEIQNKAA